MSETKKEKKDLIHIGIGEFKVASSGILTCRGLGSCVGTALYDAKSKIGGLAHIMLPDSTQVEGHGKPTKFADKAIEMMLAKMISVGAKKNFVEAKIAGGAIMFSSAETTRDIGERNVVAVRNKLEKEGIKLAAEDTGGTHGRTIEFDIASGMLTVKTADGRKMRF
jgi:chemotaxis protein CheD